MATLDYKGYQGSTEVGADADRRSAKALVRQDALTGSDIPTHHADDWSDFLAATENLQVPEEFLCPAERL